MLFWSNDFIYYKTNSIATELLIKFSITNSPTKDTFELGHVAQCPQNTGRETKKGPLVGMGKRIGSVPDNLGTSSANKRIL